MKSKITLNPSNMQERMPNLQYLLVARDHVVRKFSFLFFSSTIVSRNSFMSPAANLLTSVLINSIYLNTLMSLGVVHSRARAFDLFCTQSILCPRTTRVILSPCYVIFVHLRRCSCSSLNDGTNTFSFFFTSSY